MKNLPNRFSGYKTTTRCHHIHCRGFEWKVNGKNNFAIVVTALIDAIFCTLYTVMTNQDIFRIGLKNRYSHYNALDVQTFRKAEMN